MKLFKSVQFVFLMILILSCEKDENQSIITANGLVIWTGDYAVDGCGFYIDVNNTEYKPENELVMDESFKSNEAIPVTIVYMVKDKDKEYLCGISPEIKSIDFIEILSITKK